MNRNVTIIVVILVLVVIAGYLVWIRSKYEPQMSPAIQNQATMTQSPSATQSASPSATTRAQEATGSVKPKTSTPSASSR